VVPKFIRIWKHVRVEDIPGSGDCEARSVDWGQPVLFATSWAYVIVGMALAIWVSRREDASRGWGWLFAAGLILTGLGSVDYHGPAVAPQPLAHDGGLALALLVAWGIDLTRLAVPIRRVVGVLVGVTVLGAALMVWESDLSPFLAGVVAVSLGWSEILIYRRGLRRWGWTQTAVVASLAVGVVAFAMSRTGGPWCQPESWVQGHGLWHLLTASALGLWLLGALPGSAATTARAATTAAAPSAPATSTPAPSARKVQ
jgi:hypothetical protein